MLLVVKARPDGCVQKPWCEHCPWDLQADRLAPLRPHLIVEGSLGCRPLFLKDWLSLFRRWPCDKRVHQEGTQMPWAASRGVTVPASRGNRTSLNRCGWAREGARRPHLTPYRSVFLQGPHQPGWVKARCCLPSRKAVLRGAGFTGPPQQVLSSKALEWP